MTVTLDARGGTVTSRDGRVRLDVPPGVFVNPARVSIARRPVTPVGGRDWLLARFDLRAIDAATDTELSTFEQPITLTVDLRGVATRAQMPPDTRLTILVAADEAGMSWSEAPGVFMPEYGLLVTPIRHFSEWAGGYMQEGWKLAYNAPAVSLFSGAATYNYPIDVPAGRNGFAPQVNLSYNSRRVDGLLEPDWNTQFPLGLGWSLDSLDVLREGVHVNSWGALEFPDTFTLLVNGTGYDLVPEVTGQSHGFYRAKDAPWLLARRINDCSDDGHCGNLSGSRAPNASGEYWRVWLGDGTQARLGYTSNAEQTDLTHPGAYCPAPGYCGTRAVYRWRVDVMSDTLGNTMTFTYVEDESTANGLRIGLSRPSEIKYNNSTPPGAATPQYTTRIELTHATNPAGQDINRIKVWHAGALVREYRLTLSDYGDYASADTCGQHVYVRELTAIQVFNASSSALPATTFSYTMLPHRNNGCAHYWYLSSVSNGYGGSTTFSYTADGRQRGCWPQPTWINGNLTCDDAASVGLSYRVSQTLTGDGVSASPAKVTYDYGLRCYNQNAGGSTGGGVLCRENGYVPETNALDGHSVVTETVYAYDNSLVRRGIHTFDIADYGPFRGRELTAQTREGAGGLLTQDTQAYATLPFGGTTFAYVRQADHTTYAGGIAATRQVSYTYDAYGNLTRQYEMGDAARSGDERTLQYGFNPTNTVTVTAALYTYWPRTSPTASTQLAGFEAGKAIDGNTGATNGWSSQTYTWHTYTEWIEIGLDATHPVDMVKLYPYQWDGVEGFPQTLRIYTYDGGQWTLAQTYAFPNNPAPGQMILRLPGVFNASRVRLEGTDLRPNMWGSYFFALAEVEVGRSADLTLGKWIVNKPAWEKVCAGVVAGTCSAPAEQRQTRYTYDGATSFSTPPSKGLVTAQAAGLGSFGWVTTTTAYDAWGNPTVVTDTRGYTTTTTYESTYRLYPISVKNAKGHVTQYQYYGINGVPAGTYPPGLLKAVIDPNSQTTTYTYDTFGRLWQVFRPGDGSDPSLQYGYWDNGAYVWVSPFLITVSQKPNSPIKQEQRHFYDGLGREIQTHTAVRATLSGYATAQDILVSQGYDARGNLAWQTVPYAVNAYVWNGLSPYTTANLSTAPRTAYQYDALGRPVVVTNPDGTLVKTSYTVSRTGVLDANGHQRVSEVDAYGQLVAVREYNQTLSTIDFTLPAYATTRYGYDVLGNLTRVTDTLSTATTMTYDPLGRKTAMSDPDMGAWSYAYDAAGNLTRQTDARGQRICFYYDPLNRLTGKHYRSDDACPPSPSLSVTYTYDAGTNGKGRRTSMSDPSGSATWTYDTRGRMLSESKSLTGVSGTFVTVYGYDALDRVITTTHPGGEVVTQTYTAQGLLNTVRSPTYGLSYASGLQYNALSQLSQMTYGNGELLRFGYRGMGGQWDSPPAAGLTSFGRLFRLRAQTSAGVPLFDLRYGYDAVGNVTAIREAPRAASGWPTSGFTFQDLLDTKNTNNWTWSAYQTVVPDGDENVIKSSGTNANWNANFYRSAFSLTSGKGMQVRFKVDATNTVAVLALEADDATYRRLGVVADSGKLYVQYNDGGGYRNPVDLLTNLQLNTWYVLRIVVDDTGRGFYVEAYQESSPSVRGSFVQWMPTGKSWRFHHWIWRGNAYLNDYREFSTSGMTWSPDERLTFSYDHLDRLTSAAPESGGQGYSQAFQYNAIGNLTSFAGTAYTYNDAAHKHAVTHLGGVQKYWYDANGSMTTRVEGSVTYQQAWDVESRLAVVTNTQTSQVTRFTYDGDGARVKKVDASGTAVYVGATEVLINATQRITRTYYSAGAQLVAMRVMTSTGGNALYYLHADHLGSTSLTTNNSGGEIARQNYYPFGQIRPGGTGSMPTDIAFTGQRLDASTGGLMFYQARYFSPVIGRFVSADTLVPEPGNPQSLNRYSYVNNNPLKYIDPSGHRTCSAQQAATGDETCDQNITNEEEEYQPPLELPDPIPEDWLDLPVFQQPGSAYAAAVAWATYWSNPGKYSSDYFVFWWAFVYREHCGCGASETPLFIPQEWKPYVPEFDLIPLALLDIQRSHNALGGGGASGLRRLRLDERIVIFESKQGSGTFKTYDPTGISAQSLNVTGSATEAYYAAFKRQPLPGEPYWETTAWQIGATGRFAYNDAIGSPGHVSIYGGRDAVEFMKIWTKKTFGP